MANLEAGYIPKRSDVVPRILAVLQNDNGPAGNRAEVHNEERDSAHVTE